MPFFALPGKLGELTVLASFLVQLKGVTVIFVWSFGMGLATFWVMKKTIGIRLSAEDELRGLNVAEHGAQIGTGRCSRNSIASRRSIATSRAASMRIRG